ncbi:MAG TPA: pyroglutamyl-peptidase I [Azospirillum sp.]|nr:pyroglutamyl-peptidase I [Azospirillum sp.]
MTGPILLTGFQPFGVHAVNPTMLLMDRLAGMEGVVTAILPVEYDRCGIVFADLLDRHKPVAALCFGLSYRTDSVLIERRAWNRDETEQADNAGVVRTDSVIVEGAPTSYGCGLPESLLERALAGAGVPVGFSDHAGGFVCNHLYYRARHTIETRGITVPMAFIHVPPLPEQATDRVGGLAIERLEAGARALVGAVLQRL